MKVTTRGSGLAEYLTLVDWNIQGNWVPLQSAAGPEAVVLVRFRVLRTGQVKDIEIEKGSGNTELDASALQAIRRSTPFPPFSNLIMEPFLQLRYRFVIERE
jgi:TonB family protein